ncbi:MAG: hypothetical protein ABJF11_01490 [Reichenbachiella sp.]|uniref:hypothetical protein n=1 Tax=Reichenbachiella sp. TaxID=2184521 RepID=UPI00326381F9
MKGKSKYWNKISLSIQFVIFASTVVSLPSCTEPDPFPIIPQIQFNNMEYVELLENGSPDSLILYLNFQDGDGDLGIEGDEDLAPFHDFDIVLDNEGKVVTIGQPEVELPLFLFTPRFGVVGRFSDEDNRPAFDCANYDTLYIKNDRSDLYLPGTPLDQIDLTEFYKDTVYIQRNPYENNIIVKYFRKRGTDEYEEINWRYLTSEYGCGISFDGRFPILDIESAIDGSSLEGVIKYSMVSTGFRTVLRKDTFKLQFQIIDRGLHGSNVADTGDLTLDQLLR